MPKNDHKNVNYIKYYETYKKERKNSQLPFEYSTFKKLLSMNNLKLFKMSLAETKSSETAKKVKVHS